MIRRINSIVTRAFILVTCALGCGGFVSGKAPAESLSAQPAACGSPDVTQVHEEIIATRQAMLEETEQSHRSGRADATDLSQARIKLAEARLHLAEAEGKPDEAVRELQAILALRQEALKTLQRRLGGGRVSQNDLHEAQIAVLETRIRLTRSSQATT